MNKRIISFMLCILLCFSLLPTCALADELEPEEEAAVTAEEAPEELPEPESGEETEEAADPAEEPGSEPAEPADGTDTGEEESSEQPEEPGSAEQPAENENGEATETPAEPQEGELPAENPENPEDPENTENPENPEATEEGILDEAPALEPLDAAAFTVTSAGSETEGTVITASRSGNDLRLILPATVSPTAVVLNFVGCSSMTVTGAAASEEVETGTAVDLTQFCGVQPDGVYNLSLTYGMDSFSLEIRFSANSAAMYLASDDPVNMGRDWVESSKDKSNKATGSMVMQNPDGSVVYSGNLTQIKGRGNTTWEASKKPYQIKLGTKTDLLETGSKSNKNKTWVLLANTYDPTLIHNLVTYNLAQAVGLTTAVQCRIVDLYYDSEYRGAYLLCEKVSIDTGRVEIHDLEGDNEDANPGVEDFSTFKRGRGRTANGAIYYYCKDMQSPADITGGYLLEMEYPVRAKQEICYFVTSRGRNVVVKSPEYCSKEEMIYIASLYQEFENAVYNGGINKTTGLSVSDYLDMESAAACYLVNELTKNPDAFFSSAYVYKDTGDDVFHFGPMWDYDITYGFGNNVTPSNIDSVGNWYASTHNMGSGLTKVPEFQSVVCEVWTEKFVPLINNVLLGGYDAVSSDGTLHSLYWYEEQTAASAACNYTLWDIKTYNGKKPGGTTYDANISWFNNWVNGRLYWMNSNIAGQYGASPGRSTAPLIEAAKTGLTVTWESVPGAASYAVYYRAGTGKWTFLKNSVFEEYRFTKKMKSGTEYSFYVVCKDCYGTPILLQSTAVASYTYVAAPRLKSAVMIDGGISLKWYAVTGAAGYRVYYQPEGGAWTEGPTVSGTSAVVTGLSDTNRYTVAVCSVDSEGAEISGLSANTKAVVFVKTPAIASAEYTIGEKRLLTVTAKEDEIPVTGYQVQYCLNSEFKGTKTAKATSDGELTVTFTNPRSGSAYYVRIRSWVKIGSKRYYSMWSDPTCVTP